MKKDDPIRPLMHLVDDPGFASKDELLSFCLAVGIFNGEVRKNAPVPPRNWDPSIYNIWPMVQMIAYTNEPDMDDMKEMKAFLYPYLLGGIEKVRAIVGERRGIDALKELASTIPP